jgi:hypothetical protein
VWRVGYDRRAFVAQSRFAIAVILVCYFFTPVPPAPPDNPRLTVNLNYVFGLSSQGPQRWMPGWAWLAAMVVAVPLLMYWPTHWALRKLFDGDATTAADAGAAHAREVGGTA